MAAAKAPERENEVRAEAKYVRVSARKARLVTEHIRGRSVPEARTVLAFTERAVAKEIEKVLHSAVSNAEANHGMIGDELFVSTVYVDEGPTIKRWRARARGRVARINKRTCHITIVVDRLADDRLTILQAKEANRTAAGRRRGATSSTAARRDRVARSRERAEGLKSGAATETAKSHMTEAEVAEAQGEWTGSKLPKADGSAPKGFEIKGNADSMLYHEPDTRYYDQTVAEVYFDTVENAEAAGFQAPGSTPANTDDSDADAGDEGIDDASDTDESTSEEENS